MDPGDIRQPIERTDRKVAILKTEKRDINNKQEEDTKKAIYHSDLTFKLKQNEDQYKFNIALLHNLYGAQRALGDNTSDTVKGNLDQMEKLLRERQKCIMIADRSKLPCSSIEEHYKSESADYSDENNAENGEWPLENASHSQSVSLPRAEQDADEQDADKFTTKKFHMGIDCDTKMGNLNISYNINCPKLNPSLHVGGAQDVNKIDKTICQAIDVHGKEASSQGTNALTIGSIAVDGGVIKSESSDIVSTQDSDMPLENVPESMVYSTDLPVSQAEKRSKRVKRGKGVQSQLSKNSSKKCEVCNKVFKKPSLLKRHSFVHFATKDYACDKCDKQFKNPLYLDRHIKDHHPLRGKLYSCKECGKTFENISLRKKHCISHNKDTENCVKMELPCGICSKVFHSATMLKRHYFIHSTTKEFECKKCNKKYKSPLYLRTHIKQMHSGKVFSCEKCSETFENITLWRRHRKMHREKSFQCEVCDKFFPERTAYRKHLMMHTGERPHQCHICPKRYTTPEDLKVHIMTHSSERPYACKICNKAFKVPGYLRTHMRLHAGETHTCHICQRQFRIRRCLLQHLLTHTGEKPHVCDICGKSYASPKSLKFHHMSHTGEKPHECKVCKKTFTRPWVLIEHQRIHTGEKPYVCDVCGRGFRISLYLTKHLQTHVNRHHKCDICMKTFSSTDDLQEHCINHKGYK